MIKLTQIPCSKNPKAPNLVLIPGGPGLSSNTLRSLDLLSRSFHLHYVDFPGTNGNPYGKKQSFEELCDDLQKAIHSIEGVTYVLGHSFGGFFAAYVSLWMEVDGLICLSSPFSQKSLQVVNENYIKLMTPKLMKAQEAWEKTPSNSTFAHWLSEYGELYFSKESADNGRTLLMNDPVCFQSFLDNREDASQMELLLGKTAQNPIKKLMLTGADDLLIPVGVLKSDATRGNFDFEVVQKASHFSMFDQPEIVASLIENYFCDRQEVRREP